MNKNYVNKLAFPSHSLDHKVARLLGNFFEAMGSSLPTSGKVVLAFKRASEK